MTTTIRRTARTRRSCQECHTMANKQLAYGRGSRFTRNRYLVVTLLATECAEFSAIRR